MKCNIDNLNYDEIPKSLNNTKENSFWQEIMELKPIYQIIFIVLILILLTVIVYLIIKFKGSVSHEKKKLDISKDKTFKKINNEEEILNLHIKKENNEEEILNLHIEKENNEEEILNLHIKKMMIDKFGSEISLKLNFKYNKIELIKIQQEEKDKLIKDLNQDNCEEKIMRSEINSIASCINLIVENCIVKINNKSYKIKSLEKFITLLLTLKSNYNIYVYEIKDFYEIKDVYYSLHNIKKITDFYSWIFNKYNNQTNFEINFKFVNNNHK